MRLVPVFLMSLSHLVRFGSSGWTYEGWQGLVYLKQYTKTSFTQECLGEYCEYLYERAPCFRTVSNDATLYQPPTPKQLRKFLSQIPEDFEMCFKVWEEITIARYPKQPRYGEQAGQPNQNFLNAKLFTDRVLTPYREAKFASHTGPFLFELQRSEMSGEELCSRLHLFFSQLPKEFQYAVEIRNPSLMCPAYHQILDRHGVAHVYNHWSSMPSLAEQHRHMKFFTAPFTVVRLLTPLDMTYAAGKRRAEPYNKIVAELPEMRRDTVALVKQAIAENRRAYVIVNNRAEGNAPLTIQGLMKALKQGRTHQIF